MLWAGARLGEGEWFRPKIISPATMASDFDGRNSRPRVANFKEDV